MNWSFPVASGWCDWLNVLSFCPILKPISIPTMEIHVSVTMVLKADILTSESPGCSVDSPQDQTAASLLDPAACCCSAPALSDGTGWTAGPRPDGHSWSRTNRSYLIWINNERFNFRSRFYGLKSSIQPLQRRSRLCDPLFIQGKLQLSSSRSAHIILIPAQK